MQTGLWTTKDGRKIPIHDMTDVHLFNTLKFMQKWCNNKRRKPFDEAVKPIFWCLLEEAEDRKIVEKFSIEDLGRKELKFLGERRK